MKCLTPRVIKTPIYNSACQIIKHDMYLVPCGHCVGCLKQDQIDWSLRLKLEAESSISSYFVTLTIEDGQLDNVNLCKKDYQDFLKRLRERVRYEYNKRHLINVSLRFFGVGEYGRKNNRPHYHFMLYNIPLHDKRQVHKLCCECWPYGFVYVEDCNDETCGYIAKYLTKLDPRPHAVESFRTMSLRPALGYQWFLDHSQVLSVIEQNKKPVLHLRNGKCYSLPRSVKRKFLSIDTQLDIRDFACIDESKLDADWWSHFHHCKELGRQANKVAFERLNRRFQV